MAFRRPLVLATITAAALAACASLGPVTIARASDVDAPAAVVPDVAASPSAGPVGTTPADASVPITVVLHPSDRSALRDLVDDASTMTTGARTDAIADTAPVEDAATTVRSALAAAGFTVDDAESGTWDVAATGTAAQAEALFGVTLVGTGTAMHPTGSPTMPTSFAGTASTVLGLDARPVVQPNAATFSGLTPADLAGAYSSVAASTAGAGATIATIQFSGWNSSDLTTYAKAVGRAMPSVTQIGIDGASPSKANGSGDVEVALDQEMLLAAAPAAAQRIYVAPMSAVGMYDAYSAIADDVATQHITAVSTSWGSCEAGLSSNVRAVLEDAIDRIVANGATMFAASGDTGATCTDSLTPKTTSVQYPASSPAVIGVGGTTLQKSGSTWGESVWNTSAGSSGGGASSVIARPSYQSAVGLAGSTRLVPDVAGTADPSKGPGVYIGSAGGYVLGGGTSLAAPLLAGQLAATLSARGCAAGIGDIHQTLYAHPGDFRDVTTGSNGAIAARTGYDAATGLGSPVWSTLSKDLPKLASCPLTAAATTPTQASSPTATSTTAAKAPAATVALAAGKAIASPHGQYKLTMQSDGNLVQTGNGRALWATNTSGHAGATAVLLANGNLAVMSSTSTVLWTTKITGRTTPSTLGVTDRGLVALTAGGTTLWSNGRPGADTLTAVSTLGGNGQLWDTKQQRELVFQTDGNLVLYKAGKAQWSSRTNGKGATRLVLQADGNLVIYTAANKALWASGTSRYGGSGMRLVMQADGNLVLYKGTKAVWATGTH